MSAGNTNIGVSFKVTGNELSSYIDQIQTKSDKLTQTAIAGAIAQSNKGKEQLSIINQQIASLDKKAKIESQAARLSLGDKRELDLLNTKEHYNDKIFAVEKSRKLSPEEKEKTISELSKSEKEDQTYINNSYKENLTVLKEQERQQKLQTQLSRENVDTLKQTARDNVRAIMTGDKKLEDVISGAQTDEEKLVAKLTEEGVTDEQKKEKKEGKQGSGLIGGLLTVDNFNRLVSSAGQLTQSQNGFDMIQPASSMAGRVIGGILGGVVGAFAGGVGALAGAGAGSAIGGSIGDVFGGLQQREALSKEKFLQAKNKYNATTGDYLSTQPEMSDVGVSYLQSIQMQTDFARKRGDRESSQKTMQDAVYAEKGFGVDQGTSAVLIELQRSAKDGNKDLAGLIGGVIEKGLKSYFKNGDLTFLNEFLSKFSSLQKELLKTNNTVATGTTFDILQKFNSIGGQFATSDPRSQGNISAINNSLSNPSSEGAKALEYSVLRKENPGAGIFDIREKMQQGLANPELLKGVLSSLDKFGGGDQFQMNQLSGMFPGLPLSAVRSLYKDKDKLMKGDLSTEELKNKYLVDFEGKAKENTTTLEKNQAKIENAVLDGTAVKTMADALADAIKVSLSGAVIETKDGTMRLKTNNQIRENVVKSAQNASFNEAIKSVVPVGIPDFLIPNMGK